jgi:DNA-binding CsgD family transcriptional regulator
LEGAKSAALDRIDHGIILVNSHGRVLFANRVAGAIIALGDGLALSPEGLQPASTQDGRRLGRLIAQVASGGSGGTMRVARPSLGEPFLLLVAPTRPQGPWPINEHPAAIIFITDPDRPATPDHQLLMELFDLTSAEARVALSIAAGNGAQESARALRMSAHTVHTHLRRIFRKLGVHRQADLVRVLMRAGIVVAGYDHS